MPGARARAPVSAGGARCGSLARGCGGIVRGGALRRRGGRVACVAIVGSSGAGKSRTLRKIIETDINPFTPEWEEAKIYPAHKIMKTLGNAGLPES